MSDSQNIIDALKNQGAPPDLNQIALIKKLCEIKFSGLFSIFNIFFTQKNMGLYIWGDVGRGKTLIVKEYIKQLKRLDIESFHYIDFMSFIHNQLNNNAGNKNPLNKVAKTITSNSNLIFIDEFQVEDVADAMIIGDLLFKILNFGTRIIFTSNSHPNDLYKNGLQRKKFIDTLKISMKDIDIYNLKGDTDYRTRNIIGINTLDQQKSYSDKDILGLIKENFTLDQSMQDKIFINDRKFNCKLKSNNILWIEYSDFFMMPTGSKDYKQICQNFDWIFISNFTKSDDDSSDTIRRFISFIDISYAEKTKVKFFTNHLDIANLYKGFKLEILWNRCVSRLYEMQTYEYLKDD